MDATTADHQQQVELIDELVKNVITSNLPKVCKIERIDVFLKIIIYLHVMTLLLLVTLL